MWEETMTPEGRIVQRVKRVAREQGLRLVRLSLRPGVEVGWPDILIMGHSRGLLWVECKAPGKPLRLIQQRRRDEVMRYGHEYAKIDSLEDASAVLLAFARRCEGRV
jgi:hypothetical protein